MLCCKESPLKASVVKKCSLFTRWTPKSKHNLNRRLEQTWNRLDQRQTWHGMNRLDSPTAGYNINTRQAPKVMTRLLIANNEDHMTRTNQWETRHLTRTTNQNMTHCTREPIARRHKGKGSMKQTGTMKKLKKQQHKIKNKTQNPRRFNDTEPQNLKSPGGWWSGSRTEVFLGAGWRARPV